MSNGRKAQGDIDKLLKKIGEGIDDYEELYNKFDDAPSQALKERFEGDLKKEIKKLQRLREQVKALVQSPDVKDTKQLDQARRRIEEKMEAFKVVERETKTKTFSKEGLANLRNDSSETPQAHTESWIKSSISDLKEQTETAEFELQSAGGGKKKKGRDDPREVRLLRLKYNTIKLEQLLRLVVNGDLQPEEVDEIESSVQRYIDENADEDFEEEEELYDAFDLPEVMTRADVEEEEEQPAAPAAAPPAKKAAAAAASPVAPSATKTPAKAPVEGGRVVVPAARANDTPPTTAAKAPTTPIAVKTPAAPTAAAVVAGKKIEPLPPSVTAAAPAPAAVVAPSPTTPATPQGVKAKQPVPTPPSLPSVPAAAAVKTPSSAVVAAGNRSIPSQPPTSKANSKDLPQLGDLDGELEEGDDLLDDDMDMANDDTFGDDAMPINSASSLADMATATTNLASDWEKGRPTFAQKVAGNNALPPAAPPAAAAATSAAAAAKPAASGAPSAGTPAAVNPVSTASVWSTLLKQQQPSEEKVAIQRMLDMSIANLPHPHDVERIRPFVPPNPYRTPEFYPQTVHPGFVTGELFRKFDQDTLFFVFYYQQATYQQYVAAKELKRKAYRYHKKFKTWFQRHDNPTKSTDEYESGAYLYFDYETGWCQRIKNDFMFKYQYLEDELN